MHLTSTAFAANAEIPTAYTCEVHGGAEDVGHETHAIPHANLNVLVEDHVPFNSNRLHRIGLKAKAWRGERSCRTSVTRTASAER
jgi:hypothetical protein